MQIPPLSLLLLSRYQRYIRSTPSSMSILWCQPNACSLLGSVTVSYTHLDVYKRQAYPYRLLWRRWFGGEEFCVGLYVVYCLLYTSYTFLIVVPVAKIVNTALPGVTIWMRKSNRYVFILLFYKMCIRDREKRFGNGNWVNAEYVCIIFS